MQNDHAVSPAVVAAAADPLLHRSAEVAVAGTRGVARGNAQPCSPVENAERSTLRSGTASTYRQRARLAEIGRCERPSYVLASTYALSRRSTTEPRQSRRQRKASKGAQSAPGAPRGDVARAPHCRNRLAMFSRSVSARRGTPIPRPIESTPHQTSSASRCCARKQRLQCALATDLCTASCSAVRCASGASRLPCGMTRRHTCPTHLLMHVDRLARPAGS